jgi:4-hydroxybenzoate polyprenyltransferase
MSSVELAAPRAPSLGAWLALARVSNAPTVASNALAGAALASGAGAFAWRGALLVAAACVLVYVAGMILNDLLDLEVDRVERPERPLPSGAVAPRAAAVAVAALLTGAGALLLAAGTAPFVLGLALVALVVLYDAWHKGNPLSPVLMAGTRVLVYVIAFAAAGGALSADLAVAGGLLGLAVAALTQVAKAEGGRIAVRPWAAALVLLPALYPAYAGLEALPFSVLGALWTLGALRAVRAGRVGTGVTRLIAGLSLLDAAVIAGAGAPAAAVALALVAFAATVLLQQKIAGT